MNKIDTILRITSETLDRYRNSIPRKSFIRAMEQVVELAIGPCEQPARESVPGLVLFRSPDVTPERLAQLICGACPPFSAEFSDYPCHDYDCRICWQSWLETGKPHLSEKEAVE